MDAGRRDFSPQSRGLYSYISVYLSMISIFTSFIASAVWWSGPNKVDRTTLSRVWASHTMASVAGRETPSGAVRVAASAREGAALLPTTT